MSSIPAEKNTNLGIGLGEKCVIMARTKEREHGLEKGHGDQVPV